MQKLLVSAALLTAFVAPLGAQTYATSPAGLTNISGGNYGYFFGYFAKGRQQFFEGEFPKQSATLTEIAYRTQTLNEYFTYNGMGRSWDSCTLVVGEGNLAKITTSFASNYIGKGTLVYSGKMAFPTLKGRPTQQWGNVIKIPFKSSYAYSGKNDLLLDYTFSGGKLANGGNWTLGRSYQTDAALSSNGATPLFPVFVPASPFNTQSCNDSTVNNGFGAYAYTRAILYSDNFQVSSLRGKIALTHSYSQHTAPEAPVIMAMSLGGSEQGVEVGAKCNKMHVDFTRLFALLSAKAGPLARAPASFDSDFLPNIHYPFDDRGAGLQVYMQIAWVDSKQNRLALSVASKLRLTRKPRVYKKALLYEHYEGRAKFAPVVSYTSYQQALPRLTRK